MRVVLSMCIDPRPSTNQSTSLKSGSLFLVMVSDRTYVGTKHTDKKVKPFFKLVLWLVFGRGSIIKNKYSWLEKDEKFEKLCC